MANTKSAKKQAVKNSKRRVINLARKTSLKTAIKKVRAAVLKKASEAELASLLHQAESKLARAGSKGTLHKRTASRKISRLAKFINKEREA